MPARESTAHKARPASVLSDKPLHLRVVRTGGADRHPDWSRLAAAISEVVTNPLTPNGLYNDVMAYLLSEGSGLLGDLAKTPSMIQEILIAAAVKREAGDHRA